MLNKTILVIIRFFIVSECQHDYDYIHLHKSKYAHISRLTFNLKLNLCIDVIILYDKIILAQLISSCRLSLKYKKPVMVFEMNT